jgi:hypothetical protein
MTQTQDEQNVGTPVTPAQDASAQTPVAEATTSQPAAQPVAENNVAPATENSGNENPGFQTD